jgi:hypothetical protein
LEDFLNIISIILYEKKFLKHKTIKKKIKGPKQSYSSTPKLEKIA